MPRLLPTIFWFLLGSVISAQDFTGSWSLLGNGYKGEIYLKQEGSRVRGWIGVGGVTLDGVTVTAFSVLAAGLAGKHLKAGKSAQAQGVVGPA